MTGLPLACWGALLGAAGLLLSGVVTAGLLGAAGALDGDARLALAVGAGAGLLPVALAAHACARVATALRALRDDALARLGEPSRPVPARRRPVAAAAARELAELAAVLEALHGRVRLSDEVGRRHREDADTAAAGVFELLSGLVAAEEGARGQLAAELHDTVAQSLLVARGILAAGPSTPAGLTRLADHLEDAEEQVRAVMARTRPPALRDGDLGQAVSGLQADVLHRYGVTVAATWPEQPVPLPVSSAVIVYRFFQEGLHNVVKHADVDDAAVSLAVEAGVLVATVRDEGPGFDPETVRPDRGRHVGLGLLRDRARLAGGEVGVTSGECGGTTLTLRLPLPGAPRPTTRPHRTASGTAAASAPSPGAAASEGGPDVRVPVPRPAGDGDRRTAPSAG